MNLITLVFMLVYPAVLRCCQPSHRPRFNRQSLPAFVQRCPVAMRYHALFQPLSSSPILHTAFQSGWRHPATSHTAFEKAYLVKLDLQLPSMSQLRRFLCDHPALVWLCGFTSQLTFDPDQVLPTHRHFCRLLHKLPHAEPQALLDQTVWALQRHVPDFGHVIALDTKHILAWVKENNPKAYLTERFDKAKQPRGDPDCKLGCKRRHNRGESADTPRSKPRAASSLSVGEFYWGYASGVVVTKVPELGEGVLAELTQPFDQSDASYFYPLMAQTEARLGFRPHFAAFDAAFDAFYIYDYFARSPDWHDGFAAIPLTGRSKSDQKFDPDGHPLCAAGLSMLPKYTFTSKATLVEHQRTHYVCPLKGKSCPIQHPRFAKGGCTHRLPATVGARLRHQIDRDSSLYNDIYKQRTAVERINAQAKALGIERPYLRNQRAIANQNTLIYVLINLRLLQRMTRTP